jgi:hypothetical protein
MFSCTKAEHIYCTNCKVCIWTVLTVITQKLLLHVQLHNSRTHLLYKLYSVQLNCSYSNYTQAAATCSAAQQQKSYPADVFLSGVHPAVWCIYVDRKSSPEIRSYTEIQLPVDALPQLHCARQLLLSLLCSFCNEFFFVRLLNSGVWRKQTWRHRQADNGWLYSPYDTSCPLQAPYPAIYLPINAATELRHL